MLALFILLGALFEMGVWYKYADDLRESRARLQLAADASRSLADGTATDPTQAIVAVERAQLSMQLAAQLRTKGTEALQQLFQTQV